MTDQLPIFIYGTLLPGEPRRHLIADMIAETEPAVLPGAELYDCGDYPMAVPGSGRVVGIAPQDTGRRLAPTECGHLATTWKHLNVSKSPLTGALQFDIVRYKVLKRLISVRCRQQWQPSKM